MVFVPVEVLGSPGPTDSPPVTTETTSNVQPPTGPFNEDPHYHYISWRDRSNEMLHMDPVADGDPLRWALERIRTQLSQMLERAGAPDLASRVDPRLVEQVLPRVAEAAWRVRYHHDDEAVLRNALHG